MLRLILLPAFFLFIITNTPSQVISGPMLGPVEYRDAKVWIEVAQQVKSVSLQYKKKARPDDPVGRGNGNGGSKPKSLFHYLFNL